jgi:hypothetical protein
VALVNVLPWRTLDKYHNYRGIRPDVRRLARQHSFGRSLVLVRGESWPDYSSAAALNPPTYERDATGAIYARDLGPESNARLRIFYSDRPAWVIGAAKTGDELKVIAGPLPPPQSAAFQKKARQTRELLADWSNMARTER